MDVARTWANLTTRAVKYETGNIQDKKQANAFESVQDLLAQADSVAAGMLKLDNNPKFDLNNQLRGNVYLNKENPSGFTGHVLADEKGALTKLEAESPKINVTIKTDGDHKEVRVRKSVEDTSEAGINFRIQEDWAIFDGSQVKYKSINYKDSSRTPAPAPEPAPPAQVG